MHECNEIMDADAHIIPPSKWESWLMITGAFVPEYHKCGDYYQIDLRCVVLDGCTDIMQAVLAWTTNGNEYEQLEKLRLAYQSGKIFRISAEYFSVSNIGEITFYGNPELDPLVGEAEHSARRWFESASLRSQRVVKVHEFRDIVVGRVVDCDVLYTKSGLEMAFVRIDSGTGMTLTIFPEQYAEYKKILSKSSVLAFAGSITSSAENTRMMVVDTISKDLES